MNYYFITAYKIMRNFIRAIQESTGVVGFSERILVRISARCVGISWFLQNNLYHKIYIYFELLEATENKKLYGYYYNNNHNRLYIK